MTQREKAAAIIFYVCGFLFGGLGGLTLGADLTLAEVSGESMSEINSTKLTPFENNSGVNLAYLSIKQAYVELTQVQEELRSKKEYTLSDKVREILNTLERGYSYRMGPILTGVNGDKA